MKSEPEVHSYFVVTKDGRVIFPTPTKPNTTNDAGAIKNGQWWSPYSS